MDKRLCSWKNSGGVDMQTSTSPHEQRMCIMQKKKKQKKNIIIVTALMLGHWKPSRLKECSINIRHYPVMNHITYIISNGRLNSTPEETPLIYSFICSFLTNLYVSEKTQRWIRRSHTASSEWGKARKKSLNRESNTSPPEHKSEMFTRSLLELSPSWEAANPAATQELPRNLWNPKVHYRVHKSLHTDPYPEPDQSNPYHPILSFEDPF
jgi:hypothetical protein